MQEYDTKPNNTMIIRTLTTVSPMVKQQTETTIQGMKIIKEFPAASSPDTSIDEIRNILFEVLKQNISNTLLTTKENKHE